MNKSILMGRLTREPELKYSTGEKATATLRFTLAVTRDFKNAQGAYDSDFISCVAFGATAERIQKYVHKGQRLIVFGRIQTGSYTNKDGQKVYTTDVIVDNFEFVETKSSSDNGSPTPVSSTAKRDDSFMNVPDDSEEDLPF